MVWDNVAKPVLSNPSKYQLPECGVIDPVSAMQESAPVHVHPVKSPVSKPPFVIRVACVTVGTANIHTKTAINVIDLMCWAPLLRFYQSVHTSNSGA